MRDGEVRDAELSIFEPPRFFEALPARPRLHRGARHHRAHLRHLPGRLSDERGARDGECARRQPSPDRCATCGGSSIAANGSRAMLCTSTCCTRPTSSAMPAPSTWRATTATIVRRGLALKKAGNEIMALLGGREIHPINVRVGGFYRVPRRRELAPLVERLRWARDAALETVRWVAGVRLSRARERELHLRRLRHLDEYPFNDGRIVSQSRTRHLGRSNTTIPFRRNAGRALDGAASRLSATAAPIWSDRSPATACNFDRLSPLAQEAARAAGLGPNLPQPVPQHLRPRRRGALCLRRGAPHHRGL